MSPWNFRDRQRLLKLAGGPDALMSDIRISGNADLADALASVLRKLHWDGEEALSRLTGDIVAHRAVATAKGLVEWQRQTARNVIDNLAEYFSEEQLVPEENAPGRPGQRCCCARRDDLARLEKRLKKLESARR